MKVIAALGSVIHFILMALTIIPFGIAMLMGRFLWREPINYFIGTLWCKWVVYSLRWLCGVKWRVTGLENLPSNAGARIVLLCKHQSAWETFALNWLLQREMAYVFKKELLRIPFFGWAIGSVDMVHIDRNARGEAINKVVTQGKRLMDQGRWIVMFPEGTRVARGQTGSYKYGGARVALSTNSDIIPVAISSAKCWPKGAWIKTPGTIDVVVGPVIHCADRDLQSITNEVKMWIENEMRQIDPQAYVLEETQTLHSPGNLSEME